MNIKELLLQQAQKFDQKPALIFQDNRITFYRLKELSFKFATHLINKGIKKGDKVAVFLPNIPEAIFSFLGSLSIGVSIVPLDFMLTEEEIINFINHSEAKIFVAYPKKGIEIPNVKNRCPSLKEVVICGEEQDGFTSWNQILAHTEEIEPCAEIEPNELSSIFYTSGSTGHPKGVMLDFRHLNNPVQTIDHFLGVKEDDVFLCGGVPFSHVGGLDYILLMLYFGTTLILMERFQPLEFLRHIEKYEATIFCIVPAMFVAILSMKEYDKFNLRSLRYAVVFGAPSSPALLNRFHQAYPNAKLLNGWGLTETAAPNTISPANIDKVRSIGKFSPAMQKKIIDNEGNILGPNQEGELWVKGEAVMRGYFKEDGLTKEVLTSDGWFKTGDIAYYDDEHLYYIAGRKKEMIKVAGEIVFSAEVEEKIHHHPKVEEVAVIGVPDRLRGEVPKAFIVLNHGGNLEPDELREFLKEHLAHFKIPYHFEFVSELPKNRTGKIDKQLLKQRSLS